MSIELHKRSRSASEMVVIATREALAVCFESIKSF